MGCLRLEIQFSHSSFQRLDVNFHFKLFLIDFQAKLLLKTIFRKISEFDKFFEISKIDKIWFDLFKINLDFINFKI
jgi:hypothetical protein